MTVTRKNIGILILIFKNPHCLLFPQGSSTLAYWCARTDENVKLNAVVAIPQVDNTAGTVRCQCNVVVANSGIQQSLQIDCGLFVTRCAIYNPGH